MKLRLSSVSGRCVDELNLVFSAQDSCDQETLSGTTKGSRLRSEKALSQVIVAQDCGS